VYSDGKLDSAITARLTIHEIVYFLFNRGISVCLLGNVSSCANALNFISSNNQIKNSGLSFVKVNIVDTFMIL